MVNTYSFSEIKKIVLAGKILAKILETVKKEVKVGVSLRHLDRLAFQLAKKYKARPAFLGYQPDNASKPFGGSICASINDVIVHGLPSDYKLQNGDVLKIDFGIEYQSFFADAAITIGIDEISKETKHLIETTESALKKAIKMAKPGRTLGDIGWIIEKTAEDNGLKVIKDLTGHGIGRELHEDPVIYNFGKKASGIKLEPGMVLAIEPMFSIGSGKIIQRPDESWATEDGSLSAHFEHTIAITEKGSQILTINN
ncbi:MAG: type I methionyl aminopeptidase [bacterium]|nr:type I methionyl aminopeptidase [bacterium]